MHTAHEYTAGGSKVTKIGLVALLHVGLALAILGLRPPGGEPAYTTPPLILTDDIPQTKEPEPPEPPDLTTPKKEISEVVVPPVPFDFPDTVIDNSGLKTVSEEKATKPAEGLAHGDDSGSGKGETVAPPTPAKKVFSAALANASDCALPDYPPRAARLGEVGTVNLALLIGADGRVSDAKVQKSSGSRDLDRAAVAALSLCKFKPATTNGVAEPAWGQIAYVWSLD